MGSLIYCGSYVEYVSRWQYEFMSLKTLLIAMTLTKPLSIFLYCIKILFPFLITIFQHNRKGKKRKRRKPFCSYGEQVLLWISWASAKSALAWYSHSSQSGLRGRPQTFLQRLFCFSFLPSLKHVRSLFCF